MAKNAFGPVGSSGRGQWGSLIPVNPDGLEGARAAREYKRILKADTTAALMYKALALPVRTVNWQMLPGGASEADINAAAFAWDALQQVAGGWISVLANVGSMFWAGWSWLEMVLEKRSGGSVGFAQIALRPQETLFEWKYAGGVLVAMGQSQLNGGMAIIPLERSLLFRTTTEGNDPEGESIYTTARRPWQYKVRFEAVEGVGLYRRWAGFPVVTMPQDATLRSGPEGTDSDEAKADAMIERIYDDRMMGVTLPDGWSINFGGPEGQIDSTMGDTIMRKDMEMSRAVLAQFLLLGLRSVGTQALALALKDTFMLSVDAYLNSIADVFNRDCIPYLFSYNTFPGITALPKLSHSGAASLDLAALGQFIDSLTGAGVSVADVPTVNFLRSQVPGMPEVIEAAPSAARLPDAGGAAPDAKEQAEIERAAAARGMHFAMDDGLDVAALGRLVDSNKAAQTAEVAALQTGMRAALVALPDSATELEVKSKLDDLILASLLLFRARSVADISAAFWLGFGRSIPRDRGGGCLVGVRFRGSPRGYQSQRQVDIVWGHCGPTRRAIDGDHALAQTGAHGGSLRAGQ